MPLLITDGNGDIVYKGRAFSKNAAAFLADAGESSVWENGHVAFCKEITVDGRVYRLYIDRAGMQTMFGVRGSAQADRLFSVEDIVGEAKCALALALLPQMLAHTYGRALHECGGRHRNEDSSSCVSALFDVAAAQKPHRPGYSPYRRKSHRHPVSAGRHPKRPAVHHHNKPYHRRRRVKCRLLLTATPNFGLRPRLW